MEQKYSNFQDEQLVKMFQEGNDDVVNYLLEKYTGLIVYRTKNFYIKGADREDVVQEGRIGFYKAMRDYNENMGCSFTSFADTCIVRNVMSAVKLGDRQKHRPLNEYASIFPADESKEADSVESKFVEESNPVIKLIDKENYLEILEVIDSVLSKFEKQVLNLYIKGVNYKEIAEIKGKSAKSIDNALQRIRKKLSANL